MIRSPYRTAVILLALAGVATGATGAPPPGNGVLPFVHDDYAAALEQARASDRPIFVESWAPW